MRFTTLIPNIFYSDIQTGVNLFMNCLGFTVAYSSPSGLPFYILEKDRLRIHLIQSEEFAIKDRPEIRLVTDNIQEVYDQVNATHPKLLHPNLKEIRLQPWKVKEFALLDESGVCIIIQQHPEG